MATEPLFPDNALVEIQKRGGTAINVTTDVDSFEESGFERETEIRKFFGKGRVTILQSQEPGELTMNAKLTRALWDQMLWGGTGSSFTSGGTQDPYRVTFLVTEDATLTTASGSLVAGSDHYRKTYAEAYLTAFTPTLEVDGMLEGEATFSVAPQDGTADANVLIQIGDSVGSGFPSHSDYIVGTKW